MLANLSFDKAENEPLRMFGDVSLDLFSSLLKACARVTVAKEIGIPMSFTFEASFGGTFDGERWVHFNAVRRRPVFSWLVLRKKLGTGNDDGTSITKKVLILVKSEYGIGKM